MNQPSKHWLTIQDLQGDLLGEERQAFDRAVQHRELPTVKFGNSLLIDAADWQAWLASRLPADWQSA
ncbi:hypothetical protein [Lacipirellula parvula]|uniref:Uncharacterized protein n=1 Tax=Lacipirellula parvula TaxID=2650471 RepID=A0A5K7X6Y6_9BACT|nr:hypothetical protein [Lacipirellula parvula]BBO32494.1 hypothetical protein PLANPX_2106 [Lacipirellula parvula]